VLACSQLCICSLEGPRCLSQLRAPAGIQAWTGTQHTYTPLPSVAVLFASCSAKPQSVSHLVHLFAVLGSAPVLVPWLWLLVCGVNWQLLLRMHALSHGLWLLVCGAHRLLLRMQALSGELPALLVCLAEQEGVPKELYTRRWTLFGTDHKLDLLPDDNIS